MNSTQTLSGDARPNKPAPGNAGLASQLTIVHHLHAVPEPERSALQVLLRAVGTRKVVGSVDQSGRMTHRPSTVAWTYDAPRDFHAPNR
jgi:hypothetical protein